MLGGRDLRETIEKTFDKLYEDLSIKIDKANPDRIHAIEAAGCTRLAYYERRDPLPPDSTSKTSTLLKNGMRRAFAESRAEYKVDSLALEVNADMILAGEYVLRFEVVPELPEVPHPRHLLYLNASLFAFKKDEGFLIYIAPDGKTVEFSLTKNNKMFEEIIRRARVLSTLLKEVKIPIVEPSELCVSCRYYERCYATKKFKDEQSGDLIAELFGKRKQQ
jgi:CRISPR-associated exonuclease Cas4